MVELIEGNITKLGEEGDRIYTVDFRWSSGVRQRAVIFEKEFPKQAARIQETLDATKGMSIVERLKYYDKQCLASGEKHG